MAWQGEAREEAQARVDGGAEGRVKQLKKAEEDIGGEEQWSGRASGGAVGWPKGYYGCP